MTANAPTEWLTYTAEPHRNHRVEMLYEEPPVEGTRRWRVRCLTCRDRHVDDRGRAFDASADELLIGTTALN